MIKSQVKAFKHLIGGRLSSEEFSDLITYIEDKYVPKHQTLKRLINISGKVVHKGAEILVIFKIRERLYPATDANCEVMDTYLHTGDQKYLNDLTDEVQF